jgi:hypothetical protein
MDLAAAVFLMKRDWELLEFNGGFELGNPPEIAPPQKR